MRLFLLVMCGIPASGKTTLARAILNALDSSVVVEIVSTDDLRDERYYADFRPEREHMVRAQALKRAARLLHRGVSVIHDDTNY
ncbi:MAG: AAA family ATPase, partial [Candidatus Thorarchaeota archaeon]